MILLDTSAAIEILRGTKPPAELEEEIVGISTVVEMELQLGVLHGGGKKERRRVDGFLDDCRIFPFDRPAAMKTAEVLADLWRIGQPIGDFDSQIGGHALSLGLPLLTANGVHFRRIHGLDVIDYGG